MYFKKILLGCFLLIAWSCFSQTDLPINKLVLSGKTWIIIDTSVARAMVDSLIELDEQRFYRGLNEDYIKELHSDLNKCEQIIEKKDVILRHFSSLDSLNIEKANVLEANNKSLKNQIKKQKFKTRFFGTLSLIGVGTGGYLIGKKL